MGPVAGPLMMDAHTVQVDRCIKGLLLSYHRQSHLGPLPGKVNILNLSRRAVPETRQDGEPVLMKCTEQGTTEGGSYLLTRKWKPASTVASSVVDRRLAVQMRCTEQGTGTYPLTRKWRPASIAVDP